MNPSHELATQHHAQFRIGAESLAAIEVYRLLLATYHTRYQLQGEYGSSCATWTGSGRAKKIENEIWKTLSGPDSTSIALGLADDVLCRGLGQLSLANLGLETGLDRADGPSRAARLASHEVQTILL